MRDLEIRGAGNLLGDEQSGHVAALGFELYMQMLDEAVRDAERAAQQPADGRASRRSRCASTSTSTPTCRPTTSPTSRPRSTCTAASPRRVEVADVERLREELEDRFGPVPEPLENLLALQRARIKFGQAGARTVSFRGDRLAVTPIELDSRARQAAARGAARGAVRVRALAGVGARARRRAKQRFPTVVRAADVLLAVMREAA